jgi:hypothetical protein
MQTEILVCQVSPTDYRNSIVNDHHLVVHPVVKPVKLPKIQDFPRCHAVRTTFVRIERAKLDVRVGVQSEQDLINRNHEHIVNQNPDAYAPICGSENMFEDQSASSIEVPEE